MYAVLASGVEEFGGSRYDSQAAVAFERAGDKVVKHIDYKYSGLFVFHFNFFSDTDIFKTAEFTFRTNVLCYNYTILRN